MSAPDIAAEGVTNPSIDDLLTKTDSKYKLVLYSAKRARQINAYYSQLGEGLLEYVGPLVDTHVQEKPLSIALREINDDLLTCEDVDPAELAAEEQARAGRQPRRRLRRQRADHGQMTTDVTAGTPTRGPGRTSSWGSPAASPPTRPASCCAGSPSPATTSPSCRPRPRCGSSGADTWAALSGKPVSAEVWHDVHQVPHVRIGQSADLVVVAPATADLLAKAAHGLADDLLTNTLLTARCPVVFAPAMHTEMWEHAATAANVATLRERGAARHRAGRGPADRRRLRQGPAARPARDLRGLPRGARARRRPRPTWPAARSWSAPAAPASTSTRSASSATGRPGLQGYALARAAAARGAEVTLVGRQRLAARPGRRQGGPGRDDRPAARRRRVGAAAGADAVVMAAAPADFRPVATSEAKIKKAADGSAPALELTQNPDILHELSHRPGPPRRGHRRASPPRPATTPARCSSSAAPSWPARAATCSSSTTSAGARSSAAPDNEAVILAADGAAVDVPLGSKTALAHAIWDQVVARMP